MRSAALVFFLLACAPIACGLTLAPADDSSAGPDGGGTDARSPRPDTGPPPPPACVPTAQALACANKTCGVVSNGCDGSLTCGTCASGESCQNGACAPGACTPVPEAQACAGKCGIVSNGCEGSYVCPVCTEARDQCVNNACACVPLTVPEACAGKNCGNAHDGCGATVACGLCNGTDACSDGVCTCVPNITPCAGLRGVDGCGFVTNGCNDTPVRCDCDDGDSCVSAGANANGVCTPTTALCAELPPNERCADFFGGPICDACPGMHTCNAMGFCRPP